MQENINSAEENYLMQRLKHFNKVYFTEKCLLITKKILLKVFSKS